MPSKKSKKIEETKKILEPKEIRNIYGWSCIEEVAQDIWSGIHSYLLNGNFVFAYRGVGDIMQLVITKRLHDQSYMIGMITSGWTMLLPSVPKEYLLDTTVTDMKTKKVPGEVIQNFIEILNIT